MSTLQRWTRRERPSGPHPPMTSTSRHFFVAHPSIERPARPATAGTLTPRDGSDPPSVHLPSARRNPRGQGRGRRGLASRRGEDRFTEGRDRDCNQRRGSARFDAADAGGQRMGRHLMRRVPKYVHGFIDRHGRPRWYFRRPGFKRMPLPGLPWSPEFMAAYEEAIEGAPRIEIAAKPMKPGTVAAAVMSYFNSWAFRKLAAETRRTRRNILERFREQHGDKRIALLQSEQVKSMVAAKAGTPQAANNFLKTVRALMQHCIDQGMRIDDPTQGVRGAKIKTDGYRTWTEADIEAFESAHPVSSRARLALALLLYTAQRRSDV